MSEEVVELLREEWKAIGSLCAELSVEQWGAPTDCPGWSVQDQVAHIIGTERMLLGDPLPDGTENAAKAPHVHNPIGESNERWIEFYRYQSGSDVLSEFTKITGVRLGVLSSMDTAAFDKIGWTPKGEGPYREFMAIRVFDCWTHEQDIRRAIGAAGHMEGAVARHARGRVFEALPYVVGKKAGGEDGNIVVFSITAPEKARLVVAVENGRAKAVDAPPTGATAVSELEMDLETLCCLGCGRWEPGDVVAGAKGRLAISGDRELGARVAANMNFMF